MSQVKVKTDGRKHTLEVSLSQQEVRELGELGRGEDVIGLISRLKESRLVSDSQLDEQLSGVERVMARIASRTSRLKKKSTEEAGKSREEYFKFKHVGTSLKRVITLSQGREVSNAVKRAGVDMRVKLLTDGGRGVYESEPVLGINVQEVFDRSWSGLRRDLELVGVPEKVIKARRAEYDRELGAYQKALLLYAGGLSKTEIARSLGVIPATVGDWVEGRKPPWKLTWIFHKHPRLKDLDIPRTSSVDFAYMLGVYASVVKAPQTEIKVIAQDKDAVEHFRDCVERCFGEKLEVKVSSSSKEVPLRECLFSSMKVLGYMRDITRGNTRIPWEHLLTEAERRAYIQALLDFNSGVRQKKTTYKQKTSTYPEVLLTFSNRQSYTDDLLVLFNTFDIYPTRVSEESGVERIFIDGKTDLTNLKKIGFNAQRKTTSLSDELGKAVYAERDYGPAEYYTAKKMWEAGASRDSIAKATGVTIHSYKDWRYRGKKPARVKRYDAIKKIEDSPDYPDPEVVAFLYTELGVRSTLAHIIGKRRSMQEVRESCAILRKHGLEPDKHTPLLADRPGELQKRLEEGGIPEAVKPTAPRIWGPMEPDTFEECIARFVEKYLEMEHPSEALGNYSQIIAERFKMGGMEVMRLIMSDLIERGYETTKRGYETPEDEGQ